MPAEQRRSPRIGLAVEIQGQEPRSEGVLLFQAADVSSGGAFIRSDLLFEEGEQLSIQFRVPGAEKSIHADARVAWVRRFPREDEPPGMGIQFVQMPDEDRLALTRFLDTLLGPSDDG